ncbi:MAG TPA: ABC transporter ATP-binding protein [Bacteroidales bacterium]|nr:ABC transporter ATP-binding protein [Bacteroidales bacterium]HPS16702.1 ABC transporter ATP-binding protein [Bacteroidales bacterium]
MEFPLLEIKNLCTEFSSEEGIVKAVDNISFNLNKGETLGIVGESGSGKSITSLSIMRLLPPNGKTSNGEILYHQENPSDLISIPEKKMRTFRGKEIAMIFQEPMTSLNPVMKCGKQIVEVLKLHLHLSNKEGKEKTLQLFEEVQLPRPSTIFNSYPHELSGGQKQRVMIAMAMSCNPSILIADEPTTALDVTVQKTILQLMKNLQQKHNMSIIFISHDLGVIAEIADNVLVMYKGKIVEQGNVKEIFSNPKHPYTKGLIACRPSMNVRLRKLPVVADFMETDIEGNISEKIKDISEITSSLVIKNEERKLYHEKIFSKKPILEVKNLKTYFPIRESIFRKTKNYIKAVNNVSFDVYTGETLGLVGESGCGKTTLGRTILRLIEPTEGKVLFKGKDIASLSQNELRKIRKNIQIIFQDPYSSLNPRMTIGDAILEPMMVHSLHSNDKERKENVFSLLDKVNIPAKHYNRYPHEFSGGQRQRVCIARALALQPEFIICDESVSALDVSIQAQVLNLLNDLKREFGFTYIFISHDLSVVKFMSDRMIVMKDGMIQEYGDSDEIYSNPKTEYTQKLIAAVPKGL